MLKRRRVSTGKLNPRVLIGNQDTFGEKILNILGAKIGSNLPFEIKPFQKLRGRGKGARGRVRAISRVRKF